MNELIARSMMPELSACVGAKLGLHFPEGRYGDLNKGIQSAARDLGFTQTNPFVDWLLSSDLTRKQVEILASHLTVGETYFFRDKAMFAALESRVLPELIELRRKADRRIRIWSAGCCTGEEPYSIAIVLKKLLPDLHDWNVTILATDINPAFLQKAEEGIYGEWSFRDVAQATRDLYFKRRSDGRYETPSWAKQFISFAHLNLAADAYPSLMTNTNAMDVILCRNVLMYFGPSTVARVAQHFHHALTDGGWLIVSPSETSQTLFAPFAPTTISGAVLYRKPNPLLRTERRPPEFLEYDHSICKALSPTLDIPPPDSQSEVESNPLFALADCVENVSPIRLQPAPQPDTSVESVAMPPSEEAQALYSSGAYDEAMEKALTAFSEQPTDARVAGLLTRICANQGRLTEALEWCVRAIELDRLNAFHHYLHSIILQELGRPDESRESLRRSLYADPEFIPSHIAMSDLARRQSQSWEAGKHRRNALALLTRRNPDEVLAEFDGITVGRLTEILESSMS